MADILTREQRSAAMRRVKGKNTSPEIAVRRLLREAGATGYRLHRKDIAGRPDIAFVGRKLAIFVNGCFWHGHRCGRGDRIPRTHRAYWMKKISQNKLRDAATRKVLRKEGWRILILWECKLINEPRIVDALRRFLFE